MVMLVCGLVGVRAWGDGIFPLGWGGVAYFHGAGGVAYFQGTVGGCHGAVAGFYTGKLEVMTNYY